VAQALRRFGVCSTFHQNRTAARKRRQEALCTWEIGFDPGSASRFEPIRTALAAQGFAPMIGSAEDFDAFYLAERAKWEKVIKATGMDKE
jgi:hypothetical protein